MDTLEQPPARFAALLAAGHTVTRNMGRYPHEDCTHFITPTGSWFVRPAVDHQPLAELPAGEPEDRGDWMQTFTGRAFYPLDPRPGDVDPADIAHALSMICRYGGHSSTFYSVAEHSILMSQAVNPIHAVDALLHDASEAFVMDLVRPLKYALPDYRAIEDKVQNAICDRFRLERNCPAEVKYADLRIQVDECNALLGRPPLPWSTLEHVDPLGVAIMGLSPGQAETMFLARWAELTGNMFTADSRPLD